VKPSDNEASIIGDWKFGVGIMLIPHFMQARRLARDDKNLLASLDDGRKIINKRLEPTAKPFVVAEGSDNFTLTISQE
jgi:hypothetical protein